MTGGTVRTIDASSKFQLARAFGAAGCADVAAAALRSRNAAESWSVHTSPSSFDASDGAEAVRPSATAAATRRLTSIYPEVGPLGPNSPARRSVSDTLSGLVGSNPNAPSFPPVWSPPAPLLAPGRNRALGDWVKPLPFDQPALPAQDAPGGIPGLLMQIGAFNPSQPDDPPAGGLLRLIQDYMRNNPDGGTMR